MMYEYCTLSVINYFKLCHKKINRIAVIFNYCIISIFSIILKFNRIHVDFIIYRKEITTYKETIKIIVSFHFINDTSNSNLIFFLFILKIFNL